ncbi:hypothetical protein D3C81_1573600 [compost metagenome]
MHVLYQSGQRHGLWFESLSAGKAEQPPDQIARTLGSLQPPVDQARGTLGVRLPAQQLERRDDRREHVVQVMGNTASQLPDHFQLVRFVQLQHRSLTLGECRRDALLQAIVEQVQGAFCAGMGDGRPALLGGFLHQLAFLFRALARAVKVHAKRGLQTTATQHRHMQRGAQTAQG